MMTLVSNIKCITRVKQYTIDNISTVMNSKRPQSKMALRHPFPETFCRISLCANLGKKIHELLVEEGIHNFQINLRRLQRSESKLE